MNEYRRQFGAVSLNHECSRDYSYKCLLGRNLLVGSDRASYILRPGRYLVETWIPGRRIERTLRDWGMLSVGGIADWILESRCGRVIATPDWVIDRRPSCEGPVFRKGIASVLYV
jgi:hypothetical protein